MSLIAHVKNVFDATIGDGKIRGSRPGAVALASAPHAVAYFAKMKDELAQAKLQDPEVAVSDRSTSVIVSAKLAVLCNGNEYKQTLSVLRNGKWDPKSPSEQIIDIGKDKETQKICVEIAAKAFEITGQKNWGYTQKNGNPIPPEDMVLKQVREILKPEVSAANNRLVVEIKNLFNDAMFQRDARRLYEDVIRDRVFKALEDYEGVGPEALHRFVDEMYCKKIHDS
jgi:hypothetical protein